MHAKIAVADRRVLLVTSANLTQSGVAKNIEAGLLIRGAPPRSAPPSTSTPSAPAATWSASTEDARNRSRAWRLATEYGRKCQCWLAWWRT
jgi:phosphatidylserine/phosphatidylglycerophosphate/cardiolipin synthase-like enzyme